MRIVLLVQTSKEYMYLLNIEYMPVYNFKFAPEKLFKIPIFHQAGQLHATRSSIISETIHKKWLSGEQN